MKKVPIIMLIIVVVVFGVGFLLKTCATAQDAPSVTEAPYKIQTDSRYYYAKAYTEGVDKFGKYIILKGFWYSSDGKVWKEGISYRINYNTLSKPPVISKRKVT